MICRKFEIEYKKVLPDLLFDRDRVPPAVRAHVEQCDDCSRELKALESTMLVLDAWEGIEPSPFFEARMAARMREERAAQPAGFLERMRARLQFGSSLNLRPIAVGALALLMLIGGGTYAGFEGLHPSGPATAASPTVRDLQSLDENAQVFQQMSSLDQPEDDAAAQGSN